MTDAAEERDVVLAELEGAYLDSFHVYPSALTLEFHRRDGETLRRYAVSTNGAIAGVQSTGLQGDDSDVGLIYRCMAVELASVTTSAPGIYDFTFRSGDVLRLSDPRGYGDYAMRINRYIAGSSDGVFLYD